ncbi:hypothetical protein DFH11DRAFT_1113403 [Phellopilus nigrolimitatus]|nr:hypothetical protein DFH11DRAFT_1113403 [Phellopilus nigrolimitatus]
MSERFQGGNGPSVSYIPVMASPAPRKASRSNSAFGLPQFSLLPSPRIPSVHSSPSSSSTNASSIKPPVSPSPPAGGGTGIPKFRSLRNMLPFGPKQSNSSSGASSSQHPPVVFTAPSGELKHRRSSSSIPTLNVSGVHASKNGFMTLGPRTSLHMSLDKTLPPPPYVGRSRSEDLGSSPVISIAPPPVNAAQLNGSTRRVRLNSGLPVPDDPFKRSSPKVLVTNTFQETSQDINMARSGDLSTIIESELSSASMSKHLPPLDTSDEGLSQPSQSASEAEEDGETLVLAHLAKQVHKSSASILRAQDLTADSSLAHPQPGETSANLSASWEAGLADFRRSIGVRAHGGEISHSPSAESSSSYSDSPVSFPSPCQELVVATPAKSALQLIPRDTEDFEHEGEQVSFDLSSLDPDLAALLSPNNIAPHRADDASAAIAAAVEAVTPPPPMHSSASPSPEPVEPGARTSLDADDIWLAAANGRRTSGESRRRTLGLQSSPVRKSRPPSLAPSTSSLSTGDPSRRTSIEATPMNARRHVLSPTRMNFKSSKTSSEDLADTAKRPPNARSYSALSGSSTTGDTSKRRAMASRLYATPTRPSTAGGAPKNRVASDGSRQLLRSYQARDDGPAGLLSPGARSASSLGLSTNTRRMPGTNMSDRTMGAFSRDGGFPSARNRKRSMSVNETPTTLRTAPDWMGPRTARAFAAAGLLDPEKERERERERENLHQSRADSRMRLATPRTSTERDYRLGGGNGVSSVAPSTYAPSRTGFSDVGRSGSWGRRRSSSRTMTMAELASRGDSPVTTVTSSTPTSTSNNSKTVFSGSTATSLTSCGSPLQQFHIDAAMNSLKEKHASEMEAILGALADSQRNAKSLREENVQMQGRIRDLEDQIGDLVDQLDVARRTQSQRPHNFARAMLSHSRPGSRAGSVEGAFVRQPRMQNYARPSTASAPDDSDSMLETHITSREPGSRLSPSFASQHDHAARKRASTSSSVFPVLPSNMSMLLGDESDGGHSGGYEGIQAQSHSHSASTSPSPTLQINRLVSSSTAGKGRHAVRPSVSSIGSIASADMSMLSSGSPGSLHLKPEHEKHLGDMMSLDISVVDSD